MKHTTYQVLVFVVALAIGLLLFEGDIEVQAEEACFEPAGCPSEPCHFSIGDGQWIEFVVMVNKSVQGFANPGYRIAGAHCNITQFGPDDCSFGARVGPTILRGAYTLNCVSCDS